MQTTEYQEPESARHKVHPGLALAVIAGAQLMIVLDATIVNIALPSIQKALGFSNTGLSWVLNAYILTFGGLLLLGGRAGDILGRRRMFMVGIGIFAGASLLGGFATTQAWLLGARVLQGVGGAIAAPTALSLVTTTFPQGPERNRAFGVYASVSGAGAAIGLILGGVLTDLASWRWVFFVNVPIGVLLILVTPLVLREGKRMSGRFDLPGALTSTAGVAALVYGFIRAASEGWTDPITLVAFIGSALLLALFVLIEVRTAQPLMPMRLFADTNRWGSYIVMLATAAALFGMFFFLTQFVQEILGYSPLKAGFAFLPVSAVIIIVATASSRVLVRTGPRPLIVLGTFLASLALLWLSRIDASSGYVTLLLPSMIVLAMGLGLVFVAITVTAVAGVKQTDAGIASAMLNVTQQIGGAVGLASLVTVAAAGIRHDFAAQATKLAGSLPPGTVPSRPTLAMTHHALAHGWAQAFLVSALFAIAALIVTLLTIHVTPEAVPSQDQEQEAVPA